MPKISDILSQGPSYSFEFSPPRTAEAETQFWVTVDELIPLAPSFFSVTYGAGGSTRDLTRDLVTRINAEKGITAMAHLTCAAHTRKELHDLIVSYRDGGVVENLLALGGDPPVGYEGPPGELEFADELVALIREVNDFSVGVAAHPEPHPRSSSIADDRAHTASKLETADFAITQFFFDAHHYFDLVASLTELGCDKPVIPGIMPVTTLGSIKRMTELQGSEFPGWFAERLYAVEDQGPNAVRAVGIAAAIDLCNELLDAGVPGLHFFAFNRATAIAAREIHQSLGI